MQLCQINFNRWVAGWLDQLKLKLSQLSTKLQLKLKLSLAIILSMAQHTTQSQLVFFKRSDFILDSFFLNFYFLLYSILFYFLFYFISFFNFFHFFLFDFIYFLIILERSHILLYFYLNLDMPGASAVFRVGYGLQF